VSIYSVSVRRATATDAPALAALINDAYTVEQFFVDGQRTNAGEIANLVAAGTFLVVEQDDGTLAAAVYLQERGEGAYLGMLSVAKTAQGHGLGTRLVGCAEALAEALGCRWVDLKIVNLREELGRWYRSLGYAETGTSPYTHRAVKRPCHFVEMRKELRRAAAAA